MATAKEQVDGRGWVGEAAAGVGSSVFVFVVGVVLVRIGLGSSDALDLELLSPHGLFTSLKGILLELATMQEHVLLAVAAVLAVLTAALAWVRVRDGGGTSTGRFMRAIGRLVGPRVVAFVGAATLLTLAAYGYQEYLWRVVLPIPADAIGVAITREASAASVGGEFADALYRGGRAERIVVRELPVGFDPADTERARDLGRRIGARAVIIYREEENDSDSAESGGRYAAAVIFTDPTVGVVVSGQAVAPGGMGGLTGAGPRSAAEVKEGVEAPTLRTKTLAELVHAAAGIIAYQDDRLREAITNLELALPEDPDAPNTGIVNFYLGNVLMLDGQRAAAAAAFERAVAFYERQQLRGATPTAQDALIFVKAVVGRGRLAISDDERETAVAWMEKGLAVKDQLMAGAGGLVRPADAHAIYARLYANLADVARIQEDAIAAEAWDSLAQAEVVALATLADDAPALFQLGSVRFAMGDCVGALAANAEGLALDPDNVEAQLSAAIVYSFQTREDKAHAIHLEMRARNPEHLVALQSLAETTLSAALNVEGRFFEPARLAEAEALYGEMLTLDPANLAAHQQLAELAGLRAASYEADLGAVIAGDILPLAKSAKLWPHDRARQDAALAAYGEAIQEWRTIAVELLPGSVASQLALAEAYRSRAYSLILMVQRFADEGDQVQLAETGRRLLADAAEIEEWTGQVLAEVGATRLERLRAWELRLTALEYQWSWPTNYVVDDAAGEAAAADYRAGVAAALAEAGMESGTGRDELDALSAIYDEAAFFASGVDGDQTAAERYWAESDRFAEAAEAEGEKGSDYLDDSCDEERARRAGDEALAAGDYGAAKERYAEALAINPEHVTALINLTVALYFADDVEGAITHGAKAAELAPELPLPWGNLGLYQMVAGDVAARDQAYERYFQVLDGLPVNERMAVIKTGIQDLRDVVDQRSELSARVLEVLPRFVAALEAMAAEGAGTYQYPALYEQLGFVALHGDDAATARWLLERAVALDPHMPLAKVGLALAATALGEDGSAAVEAAVEQTRDEVWRSPSLIDVSYLLGEMDRVVGEYGGQFSERGEAVEAVTLAISGERERVMGDGG